MMKKVGLMFAGQGAQVVGMGKDLFENSPAAADCFRLADRALGREISQICFDGPEEKLVETCNCQPAIFTISLAALAALRERVEFETVICGGLSLGELSAVCAAGCISFEDAVRLVAQRGELMQKACRETEGGMAAVLNADPEKVSEICKVHDVDVANYNCPGQLVISGASDKLAEAIQALQSAEIKKVISLNVDGAYHSRLMSGATKAFAGVLETVGLKNPDCFLVQNFTGGKVGEVEAIRENLASQISGSVRWEECLREMMDSGIDLLIELGPGKALSGFVKRVDRSFPVAKVGTVEELEETVAILNN